MSDYHCPVCWSGDPRAYARCVRSDCPEGRCGDGNTYRYHSTGLPAGGDRIPPIGSEVPVGDSQRRISPRYPTVEEAARRRTISNAITSLFITAAISGIAASISGFIWANSDVLKTGLTILTTSIVGGAIYSLTTALRRPD